MLILDVDYNITFGLLLNKNVFIGYYFSLILDIEQEDLIQIAFKQKYNNFSLLWVVSAIYFMYLYLLKEIFHIFTLSLRRIS